MEVLKLTCRLLAVCLSFVVINIERVQCDVQQEHICGNNQVCGHGTMCENHICTCAKGYDGLEFADRNSQQLVIYCIKQCRHGHEEDCESSGNTRCSYYSFNVYRCICLPGYKRSKTTGQCMGSTTTSSSTSVYSQTATVPTDPTTLTTSGITGSKTTSTSVYVAPEKNTLLAVLTTVATTAVPRSSQTLTIALAVGIGGAVLLTIVIALGIVLRRRRHTKASSPTDIPHLRDLEGRTNTAVTSIHDYQSVFDPPLQVDRTAPSDLGVNVHARNHQHGFNPYEDVDDPTPYDATGYSAAAAGMQGNSQHKVATKSPSQIAKAKAIPMDTYSNHTITANKAMQKKQKELRGEEYPENAYHTAADDGSKPATNHYDTTYTLFGSEGSNDTSMTGAEKDSRESGEVLYHELNRPKV